MAEQESTFRDFGILPEGLKPPPAIVRSYLSPGRVVGQYIGTCIVAGLGVAFAVLFALFMPLPLNLLAALAALVAFASFVHLATHNDYRWVELDGDTLRARKLYTGRILERSIEESEAVLRQWLARGRITGICSAEPRTNFGTALGPLLVDANNGCPLTAAWSIEELRELPSAAEVIATWAGAIGCFSLVLLMAALVFWLAR